MQDAGHCVPTVTDVQYNIRSPQGSLKHKFICSRHQDEKLNNFLINEKKMICTKCIYESKLALDNETAEIINKQVIKEHAGAIE